MLLLSFFPGICVYLFVICFTVAIEKVASCHVNLFLNAPQYKWQMVIKYTKFLCFVVTQLQKTRLTEILKATVLILIVNFSGKLELCFSKSYISMGAATGVAVNGINDYE